MKPRKLLPLLCICVILPAFAACSVKPHGKTVVLPRPQPSATSTPAPPGKLAFELEKATVIPVQDFDRAGYFIRPMAQFVYGWLDDDHLAAIGVTPVAQASETQTAGAETTPEVRIPQAKPGAYSFIGASGLVGRILSVDWKTGEAEEVHTVQDEVISALGLSPDRTKLWYCSTDAAGRNKLSVSDVSFKHDLLEVPDFGGFLPTWSRQGKYLGYLEMDKSGTNLVIFDGVSSTTFPYIGAGPDSPFYIDDSAGRVFYFVKSTVLVSSALPENGRPSQAEPLPAENQVLRKIGLGAVSRLIWADAGRLLFVGGGEGRSLYVVDISPGGQFREYEGVLNCALSDDRKYICLVRESSGGSEDIYVADWNDGDIANEKLVFKGFMAGASIFFSPDDAKLYVEGNYGFAGNGTTAMVLQFK